MKFFDQPYRFRYFEPIISISFWLLLFSSPLLFGRFESSIDWNHVFRVWINYLPLLALYLVHRLVLLPRFFFPGKRWTYVILTALCVMGLTFGVYLFDNNKQRPVPPPGIERPLPKDVQGPPPGPGNDRRPPLHQPATPPQPIPAYANFLILAVLLLGFDAGLQISMRWAGLEQEKTILQKESIENQLALLKSQVSPHFFMNTLNNIHALVDIDKGEAKQAIIQLSGLMRHLLYDAEEKRTPLKKEIQFIESYIDLMRLRFSDRVDIRTNLPSAIPDKAIPPLLFTSLLENAFKHGISYQGDSFIHFTMSCTEEKLIFLIENSNHAGKERVSDAGIGMVNTRTRLDLLYKDQYLLEVEDLDDVYRAKLTLPL